MTPPSTFEKEILERKPPLTRLKGSAVGTGAKAMQAVGEGAKRLECLWSERD
jgi:hypothetical protein